MDYSSGTTGQIEFGLTPEMEGEYLCGPNSSFVSDPVRLLRKCVGVYGHWVGGWVGGCVRA